MIHPLQVVKEQVFSSRLFLNVISLNISGHFNLWLPRVWLCSALCNCQKIGPIRSARESMSVCANPAAFHTCPVPDQVLSPEVTHLRPEVGWAPLTADSSRTVHQDALAPEKVQILIYVDGEIAELPNVGSQTALEMPLQLKKNIT